MIRLGAVSYLNTKPLIHSLDSGGDCAIELDVPSRLAARLANGEFDAALVPVAALFEHPDWVVVSDACIACRGPVWSVKLCARVPFDRVRTVALDAGSLTSVILAKALLAKHLETAGRDPDEALRFRSLQLNENWLTADSDAVLVIGDRAMATPPADFIDVWDLGGRWLEVTGLPFVFAVWAAQRSARLAELTRHLTEARDRGVAAIGELAVEHAGPYRLSESACRTYLGSHLHFYLGPQELRGLDTFYTMARTQDLVPAGWELQWYDCQTIG
jgi:chorismate dehydratase